MTKINKTASAAFSNASTGSELQMQFDQNTSFVFASAARGQDILSAHDDYTSVLSPFDRSSRMQVSRTVSPRALSDFYRANTLEWDEEEKEQIAKSFDVFKTRAVPFSLHLPKEVFLVKTTGREESGAAYTRANAIFLPKDFVASSSEARLSWLICHETFHVLSRANPHLREKLYNVIGFEKCNDVAVPSALARRKISNPDAPRNDHFIRVRVNGEEHKAVPIIFSSRGKYNFEKEPSFFAYIKSQLMLVTGDENENLKPLCNDKGKPVLVDMGKTDGFFEQVGRNTNYIIHPEEILAENFSYAVLKFENWEADFKAGEIDSPHILQAIRDILKNPAPSPKPGPAP